MKGCCYQTWTMPGSMASRGVEFSLGPETRLNYSEFFFFFFFCNKVLLKYKRDRESFWHRHQKGTESAPLLVFSKELYTYKQATRERKASKQRELHQAPHLQHAIVHILILLSFLILISNRTSLHVRRVRIRTHFPFRRDRALDFWAQ